MRQPSPRAYALWCPRNRFLNKPFKTAVKVDMLGGMAKFSVATK